MNFLDGDLDAAEVAVQDALERALDLALTELPRRQRGMIAVATG